jgi:phosphonate transport system permease protein
MLKKRRFFTRLFLIGLSISVYLWAWQGLKVDLTAIQDGGKYVWVFLSDFFPPDWQVLPLALEALLETIQMSIIGTTIGAMLSLPIAIISVHNLSPFWLSSLGNLMQNGLRSIPSIILALIFVSAIGLGPIAGTFALAVYSIGYLAKFYQEAIESVEANSLQALQVTGASWLQIAQYGILPQILPLSLGYTLYMFEYNIRAASILGVVGAGGIGFELVSYVNGFERTKALTFILVMLVVVTTIDWGSAKLRQKLSEN